MRQKLHELVTSEPEEVKYRPLTDKQAQIASLKAAGKPQKDIAKELSITPSAVSQALDAVRKKGYTVTSPDMQRLAKKTLKAHMKGVAVGEVTPSAASAIKAAEMVLDRSEPKIKNSVNLNLDAKVKETFDLSAFAMRRD